MNAINQSRPLLTYILLIAIGSGIAFGMASCTSQKKKAEQVAAAAKAKKISAAKSKLQKLLANNDMSSADLQKALQQILSASPSDSSLTPLINQLKEKITKKKTAEKKAADEAAQKEKDRLEAEKKKLEKEKNKTTTEGKIEHLLDEVANAPNSSTAYTKSTKYLAYLLAKSPQYSSSSISPQKAKKTTTNPSTQSHSWST